MLLPLQGFSWVNDATERRAKWGYVASEAGAVLTLAVHPASFLNPGLVRGEREEGGRADAGGASGQLSEPGRGEGERDAACVTWGGELARASPWLVICEAKWRKHDSIH